MDQQRRKRPLRRGRKCFSYRLVYTNFFNKFNSVFSLSLIFIHFHVFSLAENFLENHNQTHNNNRCLLILILVMLHVYRMGLPLPPAPLFE